VPPRTGRPLLALTLLGALVVGGTGTFLLARYRAAVLDAAADRELIRVRSRAFVVAHELDTLVQEVGRLSRLAEIDLADGSMEPEKNVLRIARRDSALFSVAIAILDQEGTVLWSEPQGARLAGSGTALVGLARGEGRPTIHTQAGEIAIAAPIAGRGAMVALVTGDRASALFGPELLSGIAQGGEVSMLARGGRGQAEVVIATVGSAPAGLGPSGSGQAWVEDDHAQSWLVTAADVGNGPLLLRLVQRSRSVEGGLSAPFRQLVLVVVAAMGLAVAAGWLLARALRRLERAELELARAQDLAAMGRTAAAIAHEVKNGVNGLSVALDVLAGGKGEPVVRQRLHAQARAEVTRLRDVADDLTLFAAPPRLAPAKVDLAELCRTAAASVAPAAEDARVEVALDLAGPISVEADGPKLVGALANLARNGIEAMGPGGFGEPLDGAPPARERRLEVSARTAGAGAVVEVADRGPGLAPEVKDRLFEPFVTTKRTGTGLGLAIARRVVEAHGGRIEAAARDGGGTVFRVTLPRAQA
jgi:signal transduction histidine kinase